MKMFAMKRPFIASDKLTPMCLGAFLYLYRRGDLRGVRVVAPVLAMSVLGGCGQGMFVSYCEGTLAKSPDGNCSAQLVQDVATKRAYAVVECTAWHYEQEPNWNAVVVRGARTPIGVRWVHDHLIEVTVNADASIEASQSVIQSPSYLVKVELRRLPKGAATLQGCGLGVLGGI